jgi:hypothetical protein
MDDAGRRGVRMPEIYLEKLIEVLKELRVRAIEARVGRNNEDTLSGADRQELDSMNLKVMTIQAHLNEERSPRSTRGLESEEASRVIRADMRLEEQRRPLTPAIIAIHPDYLVEVIDHALNIAISQRPPVA